MSKSSSARALVMGMILLTLVTTLAACGTSSSVSAGSGSSNKLSLKELRLGLIPLENAQQEISDTTPLANLLSAKLGVPVKLTVGTNYTATIEALASNKLDVAWFGPFSYILANSKYGVKAILRQLTFDGSSTYNSLIITRPDSGIKTLADLKGHSFSYVDPASTSGNLVPRYTLVKAGLDPDKDVKGVFSGSHVASLTAVLSKKVDAGAVASDTFAQQMAKGTFKQGDLIVVSTSFDIPQSPLGVRKDMSASDATLVQSAFLSITDKDALMKAGAGGFIPGRDSDYDGLRDVARQLNIDVAKLVQ